MSSRSEQLSVRHEGLSFALERFGEARLVLDERERAQMVCRGLVALPDSICCDVRCFSGWTNDELERAKTGLEGAVKWMAGTGEVPVRVRGAGNVPLCHVKLSVEATRRLGPYLNAKVALGNCLWLLGRREDAVASLWDVLELDPADVRRVRFSLACWLFELGNDRPLQRLIKMSFRITSVVGTAKYDQLEHFTFFLYLEALMTFRRYGIKRGGLGKFQTALNEAFESNLHVLDFLLGRSSLPEECPCENSYPDRYSEAVHCAQHLLKLWELVPGALNFLGATVERREAGLRGIANYDRRKRGKSK